MDEPDYFQEGIDARQDGARESACPYPPDTDFGGYSDFSPGGKWLSGWKWAGENEEAPE